MKQRYMAIRTYGLITAGLLFLSAIDSSKMIASVHQLIFAHSTDRQKKAALKVIETHCNNCHQKHNASLVIDDRSINMHIPKIYQMVFDLPNQHKGREIQLSREEYAEIKKWLSTQKIY
ncbi:MAG: hypothetical protein ACNS62_22905 [Candidatus Cyclobacteriaceae bacterium M3_2C_046]